MTLKQLSIDVSLPAARALVRYCPWQQVRRFTWTRCVAPLYAWRGYSYETTTDFGAKMAGNTKDLIQKHVYYFGVWEPNVSRWIASRLQPGDTFIDVGANVGYFSLLAASRVGASGRVVSVEACPDIFSELCDNVGRNSYRGIRAVNMAASDEPGTLRLYHGPEENGGSTTTVVSNGTREAYAEVAAGPLGKILSPEESANARVIKIDVEGAEYYVLKGLISALERAPRSLEILVELHPTLLALQSRTIDDVFALMQSQGFHVYCFPDFCSTESYFGTQSVPQLRRLRSNSDFIESVVFSRQDQDSL